VYLVESQTVEKNKGEGTISIRGGSEEFSLSLFHLPPLKTNIIDQIIRNNMETCTSIDVMGNGDRK
jgi:hypothetical protein